MKNYSMKVFVSVAVLGTLAFILMMLQFPLLPSAPFLKLDFSDIPALIGGLLFGPLAVILVELIKNVLLYIVSGSPVGVPVGELANFISGSFLRTTYLLFIPLVTLNKRHGSFHGCRNSFNDRCNGCI